MWSLFTLFKTPKSFKELCLLLNDYKKLSMWLWFRWNYAEDKLNHDALEYYQTPDETISGQYLDGRSNKPYTGDCDDLSILGHCVLDSLNIDSFMLGVWRDNPDYPEKSPQRRIGHSVVCFAVKDVWYHLSTFGLVKCKKAKKLEDIPSYVYKDWTHWREFIYINCTMSPIKSHYRILKKSKRK